MSDLEGDVAFVALALAYIWLGALLVGYIQLQRILHEVRAQTRTVATEDEGDQVR